MNKFSTSKFELISELLNNCVKSETVKNDVIEIIVDLLDSQIILIRIPFIPNRYQIKFLNPKTEEKYEGFYIYYCKIAEETGANLSPLQTVLCFLETLNEYFQDLAELSELELSEIYE